MKANEGAQSAATKTTATVKQDEAKTITAIDVGGMNDGADNPDTNKDGSNGGGNSDGNSDGSSNSDSDIDGDGEGDGNGYGEGDGDGDGNGDGDGEIHQKEEGNLNFHQKHEYCCY